MEKSGKDDKNLKRRTDDSPAWFKELEDILECPVCKEPFKAPPIYLCENMHGVCFKCRRSLMQLGDGVVCCPMCRGRLTQKRAYYLEKMLDKLPKVKCRHANCGFKSADKTYVKEHEVECQQRLVACGDCGNWVSLSRLTLHQVKTHKTMTLPKIAVRFGEPITSKLTRIPVRSEMHPLNVQDAWPHFYLNMAPSTPVPANPGPANPDLPKVVMIWVSCSLSAAKAANFQYEITLNGFNICFSGKRRCVSCDVSHDEMKMSKNAFMWDEELVREAMLFQYTVRITKR